MRHLFLPLCALLLPISASAARGPAPAGSTPVLHGNQAPVSLRAELAGARELYLVVNDAGDGKSADWADWIEPVLIKADGTRVKLTELKWTAAQAGYQEPKVNLNVAGQPLATKDGPVSFGIGTHAPSIISYQLPEGFVAFESKVAVDAAGAAQGDIATVAFLVYTEKPDDTILAEGSASVGYGLAAAQMNMASMVPAEGLSATLFAAEPQIQNPTNIDIDPRGRVWAVEAVNYRTTLKTWGVLRPEGDRVVILEDTDHDGVADRETTFWQSPELKAPLGICVLPQAKGTKVIVSAAPNVWLLTDADGDDHAEKVEKLFTVGGHWDHDHQVHAFSYALDRKFYFNMGNEARQLMDKDGKVIIDLDGRPTETTGQPYRQGLVFRCDIDLESGVASKVETLAWNFRNNFEVAVDSFGTLWQSDNDDDGNKGVRINYVMQHGNYGYTDEMTGAGWRAARTNLETEVPKMHWHQNDPGSIPNLLQTGSGSPTGILINEGMLLGPRFENQMIHCDAGPRVVRAYPVTKDGAGYRAEIVDILTSKDPWYRPSDCAIAPDGSLFVADWYDPGVGGHNMGDHDAATIHGRLYRVAPTGAKLSVPALNLGTAEGCVAALKSPNKATQYVAATALHAFGFKAKEALLGMAKDANPRFRARAYSILANEPPLASEAMAQALSDPDSDVRIAAIRLVTTLVRSERFDAATLAETPGLVSRLLSDPSPQVRREFALSLYGRKDTEGLWAQLARQYDGSDRWYLEALGIGATGQEDACFDALYALVGADPSDWAKTAGREIAWRLRSSKVAPYLAQILSDPNLPESEAPHFLRSFDFLPSGEAKTQALIQLAALGDAKRAVVGEALQRLKGVDLARHPELKAAVLQAVERAQGTAQYVELVRDFKLPDMANGLLDLALARPDSPEAIEAAKLLLEGEWPTRKLEEAGQLNLIRVLGNTVDSRAVPRLKEFAFGEGVSPVLRQQAVRALAKSGPGIQQLIKTARLGQLPEDLRATATTALAAVQRPNLQDEIAQFFPPPNAAGGQALLPIPELVKLPADAAHGKELFAKQESSCITCHRIGNLGADFGPALSEIGTKLPKPAIFEAVIDPNAGVSMGFETTVLTLKGGAALMGIVRSETEEEVVLALPGGIQVRNQKSDISKQEKLPTSMMPSGLNQALSQQDLCDLVEYLSSLKAPAK